MRLYITATYQGNTNRAAIEHLCDLAARAGWEDFCFARDVENWQHVFDDPHDLMQRSLDEIRRCDALLLDLTRKPTGRAYEAGMAYTLGKYIILIMARDTAITATSLGIADAVIVYDRIDDIAPTLADLHREWSGRLPTPPPG